jgi:hypothetical protein
MPMNYKTWNAAERVYQKQGMSAKEIKKYRKAWEAKHRQPEPKMLGKGLAAGAAKKLLSRKASMEALEKRLRDKEF